MDKVTKTRKNVRNKIGLKSARSFSTLSRLNFAMRGYQLEHLTFIVAMHGERFVPVFQELGLSSKQLKEVHLRQFRTA